MKIAIWHNLPSGGGKRALYYHVRGLVERGHIVEAWCPPTADQSYLPLSKLISEHVIPLDSNEASAKGFIARSVSKYAHTINRLRMMDRHCQLCADQINQGDFDVLFANCCMYFRATSIGRYSIIPSVIYLGEPYRYLYEALPQLPWAALPTAQEGKWSPTYWKRSLADVLTVQGLRVQVREELINAQAFDRILVNSMFSRESILRAYGLDAKVCYLGIDTQKFVDQNKSKENFIIGIGAFIPEKNIELVITAISKVQKQRPKLVWVGNIGSEAYILSLKHLAASLGVDFEPCTRVGDEELVDLLNRSLMMVYAPRLEPFGFAPLEANACGIPVVAVAEGGVRETVINGVNGLLVEHDVDKVVEAIQRLLLNPELRQTLGCHGKNTVLQDWSLKCSIDRLEDQLEDVVYHINNKDNKGYRPI